MTEQSRLLLPRRQFLGTTALAGVSALALGNTRMVHAAGSDTIRVGLVGLGGRGNGAIEDALKADPNAKFVACGDLFEDQLEKAVKSYSANPRMKDRLDLPKERQFFGFDAYQRVIDSGVDVVLLCTSPHYRPIHLDYAVKAGKHVFCEKPVATDATGVRKVIETCRLAEEKKLNVVSGLCYRYQPAKKAIVQEIHDGKIGDVRAIQTTYLTGSLWHRGRDDKWSDMEYQNRNWLYFTWLSGDHNAEQHIHSLDKAAWVMRDETPVKCTGIGGRQTRTEEKYGNIFDHFSVTYEYANGTKVFASCRQQAGCSNDVSDTVWGSKGSANLMKHTHQTGDEVWKFTGTDINMYLAEHQALFGAIRNGEVINNGKYMCQSTLMAIMGRMSAYSGKEVTWKEALDCTEDLSPSEYAWGNVSTKSEVAVPGTTTYTTREAEAAKKAKQQAAS